ncbi:MAG: sigma-70 family RNA polymerase sigma factor [Polyangiaceae bacterium]|nr:sigma-70 family RNA polymerase sigma factor [Polyangiaceae bacterium]
MVQSSDSLESADSIARLKQRDEHLFNRLVRMHEGNVYRLIWRMVGHQQEAEDLTQEVFVQVFRALPTFRGDSKLTTWIYRIAVNLTKNRGKYLSRRHHKGHDEFDAEKMNKAQKTAQGITMGENSRPDEMAIGRQAESIVLQCLQKLPDEYRQLLVLRDVEHLSYDEVTKITGLAQGTVKSRLHRARAELKASVNERLEGGER